MRLVADTTGANNEMTLFSFMEVNKRAAFGSFFIITTECGKIADVLGEFGIIQLICVFRTTKKFYFMRLA